MLRAFALYFQLANIAEQHHRLRRRRAYEHEGRIPHESLAEARTRLHDGGATSAEIDAALARLSVELVVTAHPTEATRLGVPRAHRRIVRLLRELDDPDLPPSSEAHVHDTFAEEITALWQSDEVRSQRPRVADEIRQGLWFFESSLWEAAPRVLAELTGTDVPRRSPLRFGTWIGGDLDSNPHTGAETVELALKQGRTLARELLLRDVRELARVWGMAEHVAGADARVGAVDDVPADRNVGEPYRRRLTSIGQRLRDDAFASVDDLLDELDFVDASLRAHRGARIADGGLADLRRRVAIFGLHLAKLDARGRRAPAAPPRYGRSIGSSCR